MSGFACVSRTNLFHVKDPDAFREFMGTVRGDVSEIEIWEEPDGQGSALFGFGCEGFLFGLRDCGASEDDPAYYDIAFDGMVTGLQAHVVDGDAIVLMDCTTEGLKFMRSTAVVITSDSVTHMDFASYMTQVARERLGSAEWNLVMNFPS